MVVVVVVDAEHPMVVVEESEPCSSSHSVDVGESEEEMRMLMPVYGLTAAAAADEVVVVDERSKSRRVVTEWRWGTYVRKRVNIAPATHVRSLCCSHHTPRSCRWWRRRRRRRLLAIRLGRR